MPKFLPYVSIAKVATFMERLYSNMVHGMLSYIDMEYQASVLTH